jgi:hypothetical protein|nr:MAG TPA: Nuclear pore complex protein [Caudoviricetes sp.]
MVMTMQSFLNQQKQMLKEDLKKLKEIKSSLKKTYGDVSTELAVQVAIRPPFGVDKTINVKIGDLTSLKVKLHSRMIVINKQIEDIESAIENI